MEGWQEQVARFQGFVPSQVRSSILPAVNGHGEEMRHVICQIYIIYEVKYLSYMLLLFAQTECSIIPEC